MIALLLAAPAFIGSNACAPCHPAIHESQGATAHSRALAASNTGSPVKSEWAFGAGSQAITYVSRVDEDRYIEHGLTLYTRTKVLAPTPGHKSAAGETYRTFAPDAAILRCFQCHSSGALRVEQGNRIVPYELGVRCESCHGPGGDHAAKPSKSNITNPTKLNGAGMNKLCGQCHRMPPAVGSATNWSNAWNVRHQPLYLSQSRCFVESSGTLSCTTCHDTHKDEVKAACESCHQKVQHRTAITGRSCESCHMPKVKPQRNLAFTNHWIGIYGGSLLRPVRRSR